MAINNHLLQLRNKVYKKELELIDRGYIINATIMRNACIEKVESIQKKTLCQVFEEYMCIIHQMDGLMDRYGAVI